VLRIHPHHFYVVPDPACHFDADPGTEPSFQIKARSRILEKVLKWSHIPYILACHLHIDADPDPAENIDVDENPDYYFDAVLLL
jgi:hypothetical protein